MAAKSGKPSKRDENVSKKDEKPQPPKVTRQWREFRTEAGGRPVKEFIDSLDEDDAIEVTGAMRDVRNQGLSAAKHLRGEVYEVIADTKDHWIRILFAAQGRYSQVLLSLSAFAKKTNTTPKTELDLAEARLKSWKSRGKAKKAAKS